MLLNVCVLFLIIQVGGGDCGKEGKIKELKLMSPLSGVSIWS